MEKYQIGHLKNLAVSIMSQFNGRCTVDGQDHAFFTILSQHQKSSFHFSVCHHIDSVPQEWSTLGTFYISREGSYKKALEEIQLIQAEAMTTLNHCMSHAE